MGNCCSTEAAAVVTRRSGGGDKDDVQAVAVPYAALPPSPRKYADTEDTEPRAKEEEDDDEAEEQPASASPSSGSSQPQADAFAPGPSAKHAENTHHVMIGDYNLRYSYYSKRGYYPEARKKANQDSYYCETHFAGDAQKAFFAVFDGHGQYGDICSQFAAEQLPENIIKNLEDNVGILPALTRAHVQTNRAMHEASFDDSMSGTTSISVLFCGNEVHVSNVGDSRAIIAQENLKASTREGEANLVAKPLSIDQTPFRKDERVRVKKCGARILTVDQVEGLEPIHENWGLSLGDEIDENGDPPRIWHPYGQYPGTAFTRSIGDLVSEELGVTAEPEILCKGLNPHDKFIIIASDGVFEFLTSQNVVDIVKQYENPSEACHALVEEAYNRWLQFEVRTDDITAICIFLDGVTPAKERDGPRGSIYVGGEVLDLQSMQRPVRGITKNHARRNTIVGTDAIRLSLAEAFIDDDDESGQLPDLIESEGKSEEEEEWIKKAVQGSFLFNHLSDKKIHEVISVLKKLEFDTGDIVMHQGVPGDTFYLVETGEFEARHLKDEIPELEKNSSPEAYGELVQVYKATADSHPTFGELALIYPKPRANTVITKEKGTLWALDRIAFRSILMRGRPLRDVVRRLRQISLLRPLTVAQTNLVAEEMRTVVFEPNQVVLHEGMTEPGFFLITSGRIESTSKVDNVAPLELKTFDYFGEISLVRRRSISQRSIRAIERTECLFIRKDALELAVGKLSSILEKDKLRRSRKTRISEAQKEATTKTFVEFDNESKTQTPRSIDDLDVVGSVMSDLTNTVRLVEVKDSSPPVYLTLRSVSKQAIFDAGMQKHVSGERDIYVSLCEKNALVPQLLAMNANDSDIHMLYETQIVGTLESFLDGEPHGESFVRYYAAQVVMALEFMHAEGVVSRTVDPTNLMVDRSGNLRMINLRLSKYVGRGRTYTVCGTPEYLAPEQITGEGHNIAADYWALGVLMYEMLTGATPFTRENENDLEILNDIASFRPDELSWPEHTSAELKDIIESLLSPDPARRLGYSEVRASACEPIKKHPFFAGTSWEATKMGSFSAPLEPEAAAEFKQIAASGSHQDLNIGSVYTGDVDWLAGF
ncbi:Protein phosphatase 2C and cyclic nucleotide-binding/kinase domain-containing protein [Phytophthora rubi]|uniref:protein-serine/threonine phosphatase n=1 Tax=Phytophthora rubi TaxID=129364 RepID=A0A6A3P7H0_9STRA|nr:Protein phosphatase 2C and cyclic nucleotide-binding/kinase domain-containing protein [Phytophthora rubi]KAE9050999.1 Protein phosphatase 2C and cyclic nucleotide-binding/kinase domain-containing protein [Phytophthora rubi]KAE9351440.1 Protein phosphatase 2C and cyclic nucleotide-binding/kinase domain-containing protein [Phytophthora rubi]